MLKSFWIVLGYGCQNRCSGCYATPSKFKNKWISLDKAKQIIDIMHECECNECILIGGEPSIYPKIYEIVEYLRHKHIRAVIVSNGRLFSNKNHAQKIFSSGIERVVVSIQGKDKETHNFITNCNSFEETCSGIMNCSTYGDVSTITTLSDLNSEQWGEIAKLSRKLGAKIVSYNCIIPAISEKSISHISGLNPEKAAKVISQILANALNYDLQFIRVNLSIPACLIDRHLLDSAIKKNLVMMGCHMYKGSGVVFDSQNHLLPCTHFNDVLLSDDVFKNGKMVWKNGRDFLSYWMNESPKIFREKLNMYRDENCIDCDLWGTCIGGCPLFWSYYNPKDYINLKEAK